MISLPIAELRRLRPEAGDTVVVTPSVALDEAGEARLVERVARQFERAGLEGVRVVVVPHGVTVAGGAPLTAPEPAPPPVAPPPAAEPEPEPRRHRRPPPVFGHVHEFADPAAVAAVDAAAAAAEEEPPAAEEGGLGVSVEDGAGDGAGDGLGGAPEPADGEGESLAGQG